MRTRLLAAPAALLSVVLLLLTAAPASALAVRGAPGLTVPVVLAKAKPWHYWISFVLAASFLGLLLMMAVGYVVKVLMLKYGVKVGRKT